MKILVFNGSPKRDKSDTMHITRAFLEGMNEIPLFIFIVFADIFFIIISLFQGGLFRGWLRKKEYGK